MTAALLACLMFVVGFASAYISGLVRQGSLPWYSMGAMGALSYLCWGAALKYTNTNIVWMSAFYDVLTAVAWFVAFALVGGQTIRPVQWLGMGLLAVGLVLIDR